MIFQEPLGDDAKNPGLNVPDDISVFAVSASCDVPPSGVTLEAEALDGHVLSPVVDHGRQDGEKEGQHQEEGKQNRH